MIKIIIRKILPLPLRQQLLSHYRWCTDRLGGKMLLLAKTQLPDQQWPVVATVKQSLTAIPGSVAKVHNITLAIQKLDGLVLNTGEWFSFWYRVGRPSANNGFLKSRGIVNGKLVAGSGGGLCQLSGILYYLALQGGLSISERHAHSVDIYAEEERFAPLGSDATVAFAYKDLRFQNTHAESCQLRFLLTDGWLTATLHSPGAWVARDIAFTYACQDTVVNVTTHCNGNPAGISRYKRLNEIRDSPV